MDLALKDKIVVVTGASAGIGLAITMGFLQEGATVVGATRQPDTILVDYSVSKAAMLILSKALANEFGPYGIRVNTVSPSTYKNSIHVA